MQQQQYKRVQNKNQMIRYSVFCFTRIPAAKMLRSSKSEPKNTAAVRCKSSPVKWPNNLNLARESPSFSRTKSRCQNLPSLSSLLFKSNGSPLIFLGNGYKFQLAPLEFLVRFLIRGIVSLPLAFPLFILEFRMLEVVK